MKLTPRIAIVGAAILVVVAVAALFIATSLTPRNPVATFQVVDETYKIEIVTSDQYCPWSAKVISIDY